MLEIPTEITVSEISEGMLRRRGVALGNVTSTNFTPGPGFTEVRIEYKLEGIERGTLKVALSAWLSMAAEIACSYRVAHHKTPTISDK